MKKLNFSFFILLAAFLFSSNAFAIEGNIDIGGKITAPSCALSIEGAEVNFDDVARTNIISSVIDNDYMKIIVLKVTDCIISSNKNGFVTISGDVHSSSNYYFKNSVGNDYANGIYFTMNYYDSKEYSDANNTNKRLGSIASGTKVHIPINYSTGEGALFLNMSLINYDGTPSSGLIKASLTATLTVP